MAAGDNMTTIMTVDAGGALVMKIIFKAQHTQQLGKSRLQNVSRDRSLGRDANGAILNLNTKYVFRGKVTHVSETLTLVGPAANPAKFAQLVQKLRSQKIMLKRPVARSQASGATAAAAQANCDDGSAQHTRSATALPAPIADADGDLETTEASTGEVASLTAYSLRCIILALAQIAPGARLQLCLAGNVTANGRRPPRAVDVQVPNGAGPVPITREVALRIASTVHQMAPGIRVKLSQPPTDLQSAEQPPPPPYTAADEARARLMARRGWVRT